LVGSDLPRGQHLGFWVQRGCGSLVCERDGYPRFTRRSRRTAENAEMKGTRFEPSKRGFLGELLPHKSLLPGWAELQSREQFLLFLFGS
jgi:hypothetical protein